jgi:hypothetical protein
VKGWNGSRRASGVASRFIELFARADEQTGLFPFRRQQWTRLGDEAENELADQQKLARFDEQEQFDDGGEPWSQARENEAP